MGATLQLTAAAVAGSVNIAANTSEVEVALSITTFDGTYNLEGTTTGYIRLDGVQVASLAGKGVYQNTTTELYRGRHTVTHGPGGAKTVAVEAFFDVDTPMTEAKSAAVSVTLPQIPRAATMTVPTFTLGVPGKFGVDCPPGLTYEIYYQIEGTTGYAVERSQSPAPTWTPPMELAERMLYSSAYVGAMTIRTYSGETLVGSNSERFTVIIPAALNPVITALTAEPHSDNAVVESWGVAVQGKSRLHFTLTAEGQYGAQLTSGRFTVGGAVTEGFQGVTPLLTTAGDLPQEGRVTDSRGKVAVLALPALTVYPYTPPRLTDTAVFRCDSAGRAHESGTYASVRAEGSCAAVGGRNRVALRCRYRSGGGNWSDYTALVAGEAQLLSGFDATCGYEVELSAVDSLGEERRVLCTLPTEAVSLHLREGGDGAAFGKYAEKPGTLECAWEASLEKNLSVAGGSVALHRRGAVAGSGGELAFHYEGAESPTSRIHEAADGLRLETDKAAIYGNKPFWGHAISVSCSAAVSLTTSAQKIPCGGVLLNTSPLLSASDGGVRCGKAGTVLVLGCVYAEQMTAGNDLGIRFAVNSKFYNFARVNSPKARVTCHLPPRLVEVAEGDIIYLYAQNYSAAAGRVTAVASTTMTVIYMT